MSHYFDCVVDTTEMAREVSSVKHHVDATTTAVVGMQAAVIKAQKDGADHVCKRVNQGFYAMIHSQISQKMATLQSRVDAQLMELNQKRKQLQAIRTRMERDYQMISARYTKIFTGINRSLRQRITELDRPVLDFATTETDQISNRSTQLIATVPLGQDESVRTAQTVAASNLKFRAAKALEAIERFIAASNRLQAITDKILLRRPMDEVTDIISIPACILESNFDRSSNVQFQIYVSQIGLSSESIQAIETRLASEQREGHLDWRANNTIDPEVANCVRQLVASSGLDSRRQKTLLEMFDRHPFETL